MTAIPTARPLAMPGPILLAVAFVGMLVIAAGDLVSLLGIPYAAVGAVLAVRRPKHPIGWILFGIGVATVFGNGSRFAAASGLGLAPGWAGLASVIAGSVTFGLLFLLMVVFPSGRLPDGTWGTVARVELAASVVVAALLTIESTVRVTDSVGRPVSVVNPVGILPDTPTVAAVVSGLAAFLTAVQILSGTASMVVRLRRTHGIEQQQLKWVVASLALLVACVGLALVAIVLVGDSYPRAIWIPRRWPTRCRRSLLASPSCTIACTTSTGSLIEPSSMAL